MKRALYVLEIERSQELAKLKDMYNKGLITQAEYSARRQRIIDQEVRGAEQQPANHGSTSDAVEGASYHGSSPNTV
jgi:hypothetical protein